MGRDNRMMRGTTQCVTKAMIEDHGNIQPGEEEGVGRGTSHLGLPGTFPMLALKVLYPRQPLSPGQTSVVGHPRETSVLSLTA